MPPCQLPGAESRANLSNLDGEIRTESGALSGIAARVAQDARAAHGVVEEGVGVAVYPQVCSAQRILQVEHEPRIRPMVGIRRGDRPRVRREMGDDHGPARERAGQLGGEPGAVPAAERDRVLRRERARAKAYELIVRIELARAFDHRGTLALWRERVVGPQGASEEADTAADGLSAIEQLHRAATRFPQRSLHRLELALVVLVVSGEIEHRLVEG